MSDSQLDRHREFLKDTIRKKLEFSLTDQNQGVSPPPLEKPFDAKAKRIKLVSPKACAKTGRVDLVEAIEHRQSHRSFTDEPITLDELAFMLWATQGLRRRLNEATAFRTVPSAGSRHAFETYLCALNVDGLDEGMYRYLPLEHELLLEFHEPYAPARLVEATLGQSFVRDAAVVFIWTTVPYRAEWRYGLAAHKTIAIDAGHVCQNLYLACEAITAGTCAIAAYDQELMDRMVRADGTNEFVIYLAPVGKVNTE